MESRDRLVAAVRAGPKYRDVDEGLVRRLADQELARRGRAREAGRAVRNRLHQALGAVFEGRFAPARESRAIREAAAAGPDALRRACARLLERHASTRERMPFLEAFHAALFEGLPAPRTVLDAACGLHPLALPWMGLPPDAAYLACDAHGGLVRFLDDVLPLLSPRGRAERRDLLAGPPAGRFDAAFVLKALPAFDLVEPGAGFRLLEAIDADRLFVSFPARSLGGRKRGLDRAPGDRFLRLAAERGWTATEVVFPTERVFRVSKPPPR